MPAKKPEMIDLIRRSDMDVREGTYVLKLIPNRWKAYKSAQAHSWIEVKFTKENTRRIPDNKGGIYTFVARPGIAGHGDGFVLYVGKADNSLRSRYRTYFDDQRTEVRRMVGHLQEFLYFKYSIMEEDAKTIKAEERALIHALTPYANADLMGALSKGEGAFP